MFWVIPPHWGLVPSLLECSRATNHTSFVTHYTIKNKYMAYSACNSVEGLSEVFVSSFCERQLCSYSSKMRESKTCCS